jgi:hypothetical protein
MRAPATPDEAAEADTTEPGHHYVYDAASDTYALGWPGGGLTETGDRVRGMVRAYVKDGLGKTLHEVAVQYGLSRAEFDHVRRALGLTKAHEPFTTEELAARALSELEDETLAGKRRALARRTDRRAASQTQALAAQYVALAERVVDPFTEALEAILDRRGLGPLSAPAGPPPTPVRAGTKAPGRVDGRPGPVPKTHVMIHYHPSDLHLGLRTDPGYGGGTAYNVRVAKARALAGLDVVLDEARRVVATGGEVDYVLLPCGGDFVHSDNVQGRTTSTRHEMDLDGLPERHLAEGMALYVDMVDRVRAAGFRVHSEVVPGNHDYYTSVAIGHAARLAFRDDPDVTFGNILAPYTYVAYGTSALVIHHGDGIKTAEALGANLAAWARKAGRTYRHGYALTGNLHHVHQKEAGGIRLLQQPSGASSDRYSVKGGWTDARPAVHVYVFDRRAGLVTTREVAFDV